MLRYWEEELDLPIERNKQGHRLYTEEDLDRFSYIMNMKKEGLKLRAIRMKVHGSSAERMPADDLKPEHTDPETMLHSSRWSGKCLQPRTQRHSS